VAHTQQRLKEAEKLGFGQAVFPRSGEELGGKISAGAFQPASLVDLVARIAGAPSGDRQSGVRVKRAAGE
jgi:DNA repair protein RadA/Sms